MLTYAVEFIGTFIFLSVILNTAGKDNAAFAIGLALTAVIFFGGAVSGGHFNPAVSVMMLLNKGLSMGDFVPYVGAQLLGGAAALYFHTNVQDLIK